MSRTASIARHTSETRIDGRLDLDGSGRYTISTGIGFFDHMLEQLARHGLFDLDLTCVGDLHIDQHHTTEDVALALGAAVSAALGDRSGIARYGEAHAPMDETLTRVVLDISGRPHCTWKSGFTTQRLGEWDTELIEHWFSSFAQTAGITLHVETLYGTNIITLSKAASRGWHARCARR